MSKPQPIDSFLRNCLIVHRDPGDPILFYAYQDEQGETVVLARLDGYAIVPIEQYEALKATKP